MQPRGIYPHNATPYSYSSPNIDVTQDLSAFYRGIDRSSCMPIAVNSAVGSDDGALSACESAEVYAGNVNYTTTDVAATYNDLYVYGLSGKVLY